MSRPVLPVSRSVRVPVPPVFPVALPALLPVVEGGKGSGAGGRRVGRAGLVDVGRRAVAAPGGCHEAMLAPACSPSSIPTRNPPRLVSRIEASENTTMIRPLASRRCGWSQVSTASSTNTIQIRAAEIPAGPWTIMSLNGTAVIAYISIPAVIAVSPPQNGRVRRQSPKERHVEATCGETEGVTGVS